MSDFGRSPAPDSTDRGDATRFGTLFERYYRDVWGFIARMAGSDAADDVAGEVFTIAFERRGTYDPSRGEVRAWLFGIASNRLRNRFRSDERARRAFERAAWQRDVRPDQFELSDDAVHLQVSTRAVIDAIAHLAAGDRELLVLFAWEGLSYGEIATVLDVPVGTVRSRLSRSRARLQELLVLYGEDLSESRSRRRPQ